VKIGSGEKARFLGVFGSARLFPKHNKADFEDFRERREHECSFPPRNAAFFGNSFYRSFFRFADFFPIDIHPSRYRGKDFLYLRFNKFHFFVSIPSLAPPDGKPSRVGRGRLGRSSVRCQEGCRVDFAHWRYPLKNLAERGRPARW
jgi:hypothetical protein